MRNNTRTGISLFAWLAFLLTGSISLGGSMSPAEVLGKMHEVYGGIKNIEVFGRVKTIDNYSNWAKFHLEFVRPSSCRFEFDQRTALLPLILLFEDKADQYIIWCDGEAASVWSTMDRKTTQYPSLAYAASVLTGVTKGSSTILTNLLLANDNDRVSQANLKNLRSYSSEDIGGRSCYHLRGDWSRPTSKGFIRRVSDLWVDSDSFLLTQLKETVSTQSKTEFVHLYTFENRLQVTIPRSHFSSHSHN